MKKQPTFHPEPKARGECSPFKFQSTSITPCPFQEHLACLPPPITAPLPPHQRSALPGPGVRPAPMEGRVRRGLPGKPGRVAAQSSAACAFGGEECF